MITQDRTFEKLKCYVLRYKGRLCGVIISLLFTSLSVLALGRGLQYMVDKGLTPGNRHMLDIAMATLAATSVILAIATYSRVFLIDTLCESVVADIRNDIYKHVIYLSPAFFEQYKTSNILSRLTNDTSLLSGIISNTVAITARNLVMLLGGLIMLCTTSIKLTLIVFGMVPVVIVPIVFLGRKVKGASAQTQKQVAHLSAHIDETLSAIRTVQAYMREDGEITTFAESVKSVYDASLCRTKIRSILVAIVISTVFLSISAILFLGGHMVIANSITAGALSSFVFYAIIVAASTGALSEIYSDVQRAYGAVQALMNLLDIESNIIDAYMPSTLPKLFRSTITFQNVNFTYPAYPDIATLHDVNLTVGSGEKIAIVGPSGSGKSTIFNLLLRFYDITSGSITVDGVDIRNITLKDLRAIFGFVSQDPVIFSGSAFDNIIYGQPGASEKEAIKAAEAAGAMEFLQHLPDGIHSFVGEKGVTLSGGQRQRLSIARVILKNPKILLLDEATSALDSSNEFYIQEALFKLMGDKTIFMIAHRLSTIRDADRIVVMHKGRIEATGNHSDLMKNCKLYAELVHLQET